MITEDVAIPPKSLLVKEEKLSQYVKAYFWSPGDAGGDECAAPLPRSHHVEVTWQELYANSRRGSLWGC